MTTTPYQWRFFRAGGFDQALLETSDDLLALPQLDKKLWSALSCPIKGVEFDSRTLELLDSDNDGHIRVPELLSAIEWCANALNDRSFIAGAPDGIPLAAISSDNEDGKKILESAHKILFHLNKPESSCITVQDAVESESILTESRFNGDGVITKIATNDKCLISWIDDIIATSGSRKDRSGEEGISEEILLKFSSDVYNWLQWDDSAVKGQLNINDSENNEILHLWSVIRPKIDDYFLRCSMAAYDQRAENIMNSSEERLLAIAPGNLTETIDNIAELPLSSVSPDSVLNLENGLNPAWQNSINSTIKSIITPLKGQLKELTAQQWGEIKEGVAEYEAWWRQKPETSVQNLGKEKLLQWKEGEIETKLLKLIEQDIAMAPAFEARFDVEKLTRYCRDLLLFANNFVSFRHFYGKTGKAIFQAGTLYLDGRSFELCIRVNDIAKHALLANLSRVYLAYCDCVRSGGTEKTTIVAAITDGDADQILVGRNGVFYDRGGNDWDATVVRLVEHPISIRQAFWDPYKRVGKIVGEQLQKLAAARSKAAEDKAAAGLLQGGQKKDEKTAQQAFDVGKFAGIFAAIGLAIGAIGTAIASLLAGFFKLQWWQMPLALACVILLISGPSIIIAWFKLRQRNLGPLLDANGWAVNTRAKINIPFGKSLTNLTALPKGATRTLSDPFAEKPTPWKRWFFLSIILVALLLAWKNGIIPIK